MASKQRAACYFSVCVLLVFSLLSFSSSSAIQDDLLEYSLVDETYASQHRLVHVEAVHPVRIRRQAPSVPTIPTNSSGSSDSEGSNVTTAAAPITTPPPSAVPSQGNTTRTPVPVAQTTGVPQVPETTTTTTTTTTAKDISITVDNHNYYTSMIIPDAVDDYFTPLTNPQTLVSLNKAHRLAGVIKLPFTFRFYGHSITNITLATGGFIYMSPFLHQFLASTQYVAPLMANFHTAFSNDSNIFFQHIGDEFVIEWQQIMLKGEEQKGNFTFQAKLKDDGTITFVYKNLPVPITNISDEQHPVKIGLSDAFYNDTHLPQQGIIRRRIIEYHRVVISPVQVEQGTVVILSPLPTCNIISDCKECALHEGVKFDCKWCSKAGRCSSGLDWYRQDWEKKGCKVTAHADPSLCNLTTPLPSTTPTLTSPQTPSVTTTTTTTTTLTPRQPTTTTTTTLTPHQPTTTTTTTLTPRQPTTTTTTLRGPVTTAASNMTATGACRDGSCRRGKKDTAVAAAVTVSVLLLLLLVAVGIWMYYAYTHPTSASGIWLMEHRPSVMRAKLANFSFCKKKPPPSSKYAMESQA